MFCYKTMQLRKVSIAMQYLPSCPLVLHWRIMLNEPSTAIIKSDTHELTDYWGLCFRVLLWHQGRENRNTVKQMNLLLNKNTFGSSKQNQYIFTPGLSFLCVYSNCSFQGCETQDKNQRNSNLESSFMINLISRWRLWAGKKTNKQTWQLNYFYSISRVDWTL